MTNEQLVARIRAGEDIAENMAQLYEQVRSFIHAIAWRYRGWWNRLTISCGKSRRRLTGCGQSTGSGCDIATNRRVYSD